MEGELPAQNIGEGRDDGIYYIAMLCSHLPREGLETHGAPETSSGSSWYINGLNEGIWRTDCMMTLEAAASSL